MKRMAKWWVGGVAGVAVLLGGAAMATASHRQPGFFLARLAAELDLSAAQKSEIRGILRASWPAIDEDLEAVRTKRRELRHAIQDPSASDTEIRTAARAVADAEADLALERHRLAGAVLAELDEAQKAKARVIRDDIEETADLVIARLRHHLDRGL